MRKKRTTISLILTNLKNRSGGVTTNRSENVKRQYRHLAIAGAAMLMIAPSTFADVKTQAYVQENASEVVYGR